MREWIPISTSPKGRLALAAVREFGSRPFDVVTVGELAAAADVTTGALYHHFGSKTGLFRAVVEDAQRGVADIVERAASADLDPLASFLAGCRAFLEASLAPGVRRILLIDGPAVLGWGDWRDGDLDTSVRLLDEGVAELAAARVIRAERLGTLATMISGALNEVAIANASATDAAVEIDAAVLTLERLLAGLAPEAHA